jgi:hypothetical protein
MTLNDLAKPHEVLFENEISTKRFVPNRDS